jgi:hypothetical protein
MKKIKAPLLLGLLLAVGIWSKANTNGGKSEICLHGYVTDAVTKKPVQGVTVSAVIPGLNISKEVTTDAEGYFSFRKYAETRLIFNSRKRDISPIKKRMYP